MKARPILFSAPMVNALIDGRKTQTRRGAKHKDSLPPDWATFAQEITSFDRTGAPKKIGLFRWSEEQTPGEPLKTLRRWPNRGPDSPCDWYGIPCPYGKPGDLLWVRETAWLFGAWSDQDLASGDKWRAIPGAKNVHYCATGKEPEQTPLHLREWKKRPSIFMPRWASRLTLRIVSVRVERLNQISSEDAKSEGLTRIEYKGESFGFDGGNPTGYGSATGAFRALWESINGQDSWEKNPYVWVIEFEVIKQNVDQVIASMEKVA